ncbi:MAG: polysaccharide biosynthesis/export family protein, partial [Marinilabiliales bacterium]|nr:polysaccharide biosynthesis/export family protein [Marinilabiliales bacterium]
MKFLRYAKTIGLILLLGLFIQTQTQAQIKPTPAIMAQINAELQKRGLTEGEVRVRLIQKGIDVENIPIEQLPQYKDRVIAVLDEMQAEKAAQNGVAQQANVTPVQTAPANVVTTQGGTVQTVGVVPTQTVLPNNVVAVDQGNNGVMAVQPITTPQEAAAEAAQKVNQKAAAKKGEGAGIYGHTLFTDKTLDVFRTSDGAQAPDTYVLGEGDEVRITIFGASQTDIQQKINPDGYIQPVGT